MPKGYWIPQIDVRDAEGYKAYTAATPPAHHKYDGVALVRGGRMEVLEGRARARNVLREFPDYAAALACYRSPEYQGAKPLRLAHASADFIIAEGYDGVQPPPSASPPPAAARKGYWIGQVDVPAAVVVTTRDSVVPTSRQRKLAAAIPGASIHEVHADHAVCITAPQLFAQALLQACRSVTSAPVARPQSAG